MNGGEGERGGEGEGIEWKKGGVMERWRKVCSQQGELSYQK